MSGFWVSLPSAIRFRAFFSLDRDPALGFVLLQDFGHVRPAWNARAVDVLRTGSTPFGSSASKSTRRILRGGAFHPLMGLSPPLGARW